MKLSIITINYNNAEGLRKTLASVAAQSYANIQHVIVDGNSSDTSKDIIIDYAENTKNPAHKVIWISEKDKGIYNAMNKGIEISLGRREVNSDHTSSLNSPPFREGRGEACNTLPSREGSGVGSDYCYFLNAGDTFCNEHVLELIFEPLTFNLSPLTSTPDILYGNEVIVDGAGQRVGIARGVENPSFVDLYNSCMKHQASFIRRSLFDKYGLYDVDMRICSDFDWFFRVIAFHGEVTLQYKDIDIAYFENTGLSYHNPKLCSKERQQILDRYMSKRMQRDYLLLGRYPRLSRVGDDNKVVKLLLRIANKLLK